VGVLLMEDEAGGDEKIIAVPSSKLTQRYDKVKTYSDLPDTPQQIQHFRALQGSRTRQMGQGAALVRRRGRPPADPGRHRTGEQEVGAPRPSLPATNAKRLRKGARDKIAEQFCAEATKQSILPLVPPWIASLRSQ
jgi:hypothetical protein